MTTAPLHADAGVQAQPSDDIHKTLGLGPAKRGGKIVRIVLGLLALGALVFAGVRYFQARAEKGQPRYETAAVAAGDLVVTATATGRVEGLNTVEVGAEVSGRILRVRADYNDRVKKGQVLAEIDPEQLRAAVAQARAQASVARAAIAEARATRAQTRLAADRARAMLKEALSSQASVESAEAAAARAEAAVQSALAQASLAQATLDQAEYKLDRTVIIAPIDGVVLSRLIEPGQTVTAGFTTPVLFKLAEDLTQMTLHVDIDEADIGRVREGLEASFTVDAYADKTFPSRVQSIRNEPKISQNVVTYEGILTVDNAGLLLRPGMTATATIFVETRRGALLVPNAALRFTPKDPAKKSTQPPPPDKPGERHAFVLEGGKPRSITLRTGSSDGRSTEVLSGAEPGTQVIVDAVEN
ncbi:MAG: efflux RND transporter periplasmic adaptor subunit [Byssovorax sp.]